MSEVFMYADETGNLDYNIAGGGSKYFGIGTATFEGLIFTAVHSAMYLHQALSDGGSHSAGSLSALERLARAVTATRWYGWSRSLAYASRCAGVQA
ncbi:hypothetical protein [Microbispora sp. CA-102843]|uniref:hypothetical protein n=1 Tax=Microbispora sp. CA-102843 TaxID=3239952 RepID=UPI003D90C52D